MNGKTINWKKWFRDHKLETRPYQSDVLDEIWSKISQKKVVVAASPGSGKTNVSIALIDVLIKYMPKAKVLVLTHGTTVLKSQYADNLEKIKPNFTWTHDVADIFTGSQVLVTLPQSIHSKQLPLFDVVIVDEAHQFYGADMVKKIIDAVNPKYQILLTATPSNFINKPEYHIECVPLSELYGNGYLSNVHVELTSAAYDYHKKDLIKTGDLPSSYKFKNSDTIKTINTLFKQYFPNTKYGKWSGGKTMLICKDKSQADDVNRYLMSIFKKHGISSIKSVSGTGGDIDSKHIELFKTDVTRMFLVVVGRGILGFDYPDLSTLIDLSGTANINRLYQMMTRLVRRSSNHKTFYKVVPFDDYIYYHAVMEGMLHLSIKEYLLKFNGKNFNSIQFISSTRLSNINTGTGYKMGDGISDKKVPLSFDSIISMHESYVKNGFLPNNRAFITLDEINHQLYDKNTRRWTVEQLMEDALKYKSRSEWKKLSLSAYQSACTKGILDECCVHMTLLVRRWTNEQLMEDALKYKSRSEWGTDSRNAYTVARQRGILDICCAHMSETQIPHKWTAEKLMKEAMKYKTRWEWQTLANGAYKAARRLNILDTCCAHMPQLPSYKAWTKDNLMKEAIKYKSVKEWKLKSQITYSAACRRGILDICTAHMIRKRQKTIA